MKLSDVLKRPSPEMQRVMKAIQAVKVGSILSTAELQKEAKCGNTFLRDHAEQLGPYRQWYKGGWYYGGKKAQDAFRKEAGIE